MGLGKTNKRKGSDAESYYSQVFRDLGYASCISSRLISRRHDNAKIDLMYIPFNLQIKAGKQKSMNAGKELFTMFSSIQAMFPSEDEVFKKPLLLFHYQEVEKGQQRLSGHEKVYMSLQQFELFKRDSPELTYLSLREFKFDMNSEFKSIVCITFEVFKNEIILKNYIEDGNSNSTE